MHYSSTFCLVLRSGGLWHSELIQKHLITAFVPFLPLERKHIKLCIIDVLEQKNITATTDLVDRVANELQYSPGRSGLFSTSGCKRIEEKVDFVVLDVDDDYWTVIRVWRDLIWRKLQITLWKYALMMHYICLLMCGTLYVQTTDLFPRVGNRATIGIGSIFFYDSSDFQCLKLER